MKSLVFLVCFLAVTVHGAEFANDFAPAIATLRTAAESGDAAGIRDSLGALKGINASTPPERELLMYSIGYAQRLLGEMPGVPRNEQKALMAEAQKAFEAVLKMNPKNAEAHALLSSVLGTQIGFSPSLAMNYGPRSSFEMEEAVELEPNNPRVLLLRGVGNLFKPAAYGGGVEAAEEPLRRAAALLDAEPPNRPWPNWGRADAHVWLGLTLQKAGRRDAARAEYEAALRLAPKSTFARAMLDRLQKAK